MPTPSYHEGECQRSQLYRWQSVNEYEDYKLTKAIQEENINPSLTICYDFEDEDGQNYKSNLR